jgi:probable HAF family extracellular repeat protein
MTYTYTILADPAATSTTPFGINDVGQIVGSITGPGFDSAFLYSGGSFTSFAVPGANYTNAYGINDAGQIVGYSNSAATVA